MDGDKGNADAPPPPPPPPPPEGAAAAEPADPGRESPPPLAVDHVATVDRLSLVSWGDGSSPSLPSIDGATLIVSYSPGFRSRGRGGKLTGMARMTPTRLSGASSELSFFSAKTWA